MGRVHELLRPLSHRHYRLLWVAQVLSEVGDWAARLALVVLVMDRTGSATWAGVAVGASLVAWLGPGQLVAGAVDHLDRRSVMVGTDLVRAAAFGLVLVPAHVGVTVALAAVAGLATPAFHGARSAAQVEVVPPERYGPSVALTGVTQDVTVLLGYLLGGLALGAGDPSTALGLNSATFVLSALVLSRLGPVPARAAGTGTGCGGTSGGVRAATAFVLRDVLVRRAVLLTLVATFSATASETLLVVYAVRDLGGASWVAPVLLAATTALTLVGTARVTLSGSAPHLLHTTARLTAVPALAVVGLAAAGWTVSRLLATGPGVVQLGSVAAWAGAATTAAAFVLAGLLFVATTPANVVGGPRLPQHLRAVAISVVVGATTGGQALAAVVAGSLADVLPVHAGLVVVMLPAALVGTVCLARRVHEGGPAATASATATATVPVTVPATEPGTVPVPAPRRPSEPQRTVVGGR